MRKLILIPALMFSLALTHHAQTAAPEQNVNELELRRLTVLSDLGSLAREALELEGPLAQALARAEIADAAWALDKKWAQGLLREAFVLTLPPEGEGAQNEQPRQRAVWTRPKLASPFERSRADIRMRIVSIAARDRAFAAELEQQASGRVDRYEQNSLYAGLARTAFDAGDTERAEQFLSNSIEAEPISLTPPGVINHVARRDRAAADKLILKYIEALRRVPLSAKIGMVSQATFALTILMHPGKVLPQPGDENIPPPGPAVQRAYAAYVIESLGDMERREPGSIKAYRPFLLTAWLPLKQHAPELSDRFLALEALSRRPSQDPSLPTREATREQDQRNAKKTRDSLESDSPGESAIQAAINSGDFEAAHRAIDKLSEGGRKNQLLEQLHIAETFSLAAKGDLLRASALAAKLSKAGSIARVYPTLIGKCAAKKDRACASSLTHQALAQLERADVTPFLLPAGAPASLAPTPQNHDPILEALGSLTRSMVPVDAELSLTLLDKLVSAANKSELDTGLGKTGLDATTLKSLAAVSEFRVQQAGISLKDRLRRIVALAAVNHWKADELDKLYKLNSRPEKTTN